MKPDFDYRFCREGAWRLLVLPERWSPGLWSEVLNHLRDQSRTAHPQTKRFRYPGGENGVQFYLKTYHSSGPTGIVKDFFRDSKAFRALKQGKALSESGFHVPIALAAGEQRTVRFLRRAFLLTWDLEGSPLPLFLREHFSLPVDRVALSRKREHLKQLALETSRLHRQGFVHGDLVPSNILARAEGREVVFFFIDNDRTRRYPPWLPHNLWKRNLVQLNRFILPGISLQDRMRFLRFYLGGRPWGAGDRRLIRWLERKTRKRRRECDRIEAKVSFRELMRWNGPFAKNIR